MGWSAYNVRVKCPACCQDVKASVVRGLRGRVDDKEWVSFWRHVALCGRACVTGGLMGNLVDVSGYHRGPSLCECGTGNLDYQKPSGVTTS